MGSRSVGGDAAATALPGWKFVPHVRDPDLPSSVYRAASDADFVAIDGLWADVYGAEFGWLPSGTGPAYKDRYHENATYLLARVEHQVVGTMRLVADSAGGLPIEQFVGIDDIRPGRRLIECQRLMILPEFRNRRFPEFPQGVLAGLVKGCIHWCLANGVTHILADLFTQTATTPIGPLRALGFEETGKEFVDTELSQAGSSVALLLRTGELFSRTFRTASPFYRYLMEYDEFVDVYN
ncbi:N-acyl amino acid synthase FeeM domain-containing protein [Yinghuangia seranimata]|uniref:N-acyl amino acid synthase FeeM domain-containing protein n=1 Tax=Yinghuangia seranimata TaxID=408067 RepID=UPI00248C2C84|nr:GNAT family N-acyltransferase [Yinghuangia seranimata]MDI2132414.1 GNAT family N-acyltransferase [Yinghuangia seranimata]